MILYQFLTGEMPFTGAGAWTIAKKIMQDDPAAPSTLDGTISPIYDQVVSKALAKQPAHRYQSAREMGIALKRAYEGKIEDFDEDKTVMISPPKAAPKPAAAAPTPTSTQGTHDAELEFWRAIKDGNDPEDFELYVKQFPSGIYAGLAKRKIEKLKSGAIEDDQRTVRTDPMQRLQRTDPSQRSRVEPVQETIRIERPVTPAAEVPAPVAAQQTSGGAKYVIVGLATLVVAAGGWIAWKQTQEGQPQTAATPKTIVAVQTPVADKPADDTSRQEAEKAEKLAAEKRAAEEAARKAEADKKHAAEEAARRASTTKDKAERERLLADKQAADKAAEAARQQLAKLTQEKTAAEKAAAAAAAAAVAAKAQAERDAAERAVASRRAADTKMAQEKAAEAQRVAMTRAAEEKDKADRAEAEARMLAAKAAVDQKAAADRDAATRAETEKLRLAKLEEQKANDARRPGRLFRDCEGCPEMVILPAGSFTMGSTDAEAGRQPTEGPQHRVSLATFAAAKHEVTYDEWELCFREKGCTTNPGYTAWGRGKRPVIDVAWNDAKQYAAWLAKKSGKPYRLLSRGGVGIRRARRHEHAVLFRRGDLGAAGELRRRRVLRRQPGRHEAEQDRAGCQLPGEQIRPARHARQRLGVGRGLLESELRRRADRWQRLAERQLRAARGARRFLGFGAADAALGAALLPARHHPAEHARLPRRARPRLNLNQPRSREAVVQELPVAIEERPEDR